MVRTPVTVGTTTTTTVPERNASTARDPISGDAKTPSEEEKNLMEAETSGPIAIGPDLGTKRRAGATGLAGTIKYQVDPHSTVDRNPGVVGIA